MSDKQKMSVLTATLPASLLRRSLLRSLTVFGRRGQSKFVRAALELALAPKSSPWETLHNARVVYGIFQLETDECLYIGVTSHPMKRKAAHFPNPRALFYREGISTGLQAKLVPLEFVIGPAGLGNVAESRWIAACKPRFNRNKKSGLDSARLNWLLSRYEADNPSPRSADRLALRALAGRGSDCAPLIVGSPARAT